jgi:hypothetical protein
VHSDAFLGHTAVHHRVPDLRVVVVHTSVGLGSRFLLGTVVGWLVCAGEGSDGANIAGESGEGRAGCGVLACIVQSRLQLLEMRF